MDTCANVLRLALTALLALLVLASTASAGISGDRNSYAVAANRLQVPLPSAHVNTGACPDRPGRPCAYRSTGEIWLPEGSGRFTLAHELGHVFDEQFVTDQDRAWLRLVMRAPGVWWEDWGAAEWFADYYADCAIGARARRNASEEAYISRPPERRLQRVCAAIRRIAKRAVATS